MPEHGAVIEILASVGIGMGIEMDQRKTTAMVFRGRAQQGQRDKVVAAHGHGETTGLKHLKRVGFHGFQHAVGIAGAEAVIAPIGHRQAMKGIEVIGPLRAPGDVAGGLPDGARSEPCACPVRCAQIIRNTRNRDIDAGEITRVASAHETQCARIGVVVGCAVKRVRCEGEVAILLRHAPLPLVICLG